MKSRRESIEMLYSPYLIYEDKKKKIHNFFLHQCCTSAVTCNQSKYRINIEWTGFNADLVKIEKSGEDIVVIGSGMSDEVKSEADEKQAVYESDKQQLQFKQLFTLPKYVEVDKLITLVDSIQILVIEIPTKDDYFIIRNLFDGTLKQIFIEMSVSEGLDVNKLKVTCQGRSLFVYAEDEIEESLSSRVLNRSYFRKCVLPENTCFNESNCIYDKSSNRLSFKAPLVEAILPEAEQIEIVIHHK